MRFRMRAAWSSWIAANTAPHCSFRPIGAGESFGDLEALHTEVEERFRETLAATAHLPGLADDDSSVLTGELSVTSRDITGNAFDVLVRNAIDVQRRKVVDAWTRHDDREGGPLRLADRLHDALATEPYLDVTVMLQRRRGPSAVNHARASTRTTPRSDSPGMGAGTR